MFAGLDFARVAGVRLEDAGIDASQFHLNSPDFRSSRTSSKMKPGRARAIRPGQRRRVAPGSGPPSEAAGRTHPLRRPGVPCFRCRLSSSLLFACLSERSPFRWSCRPAHDQADSMSSGIVERRANYARCESVDGHAMTAMTGYRSTLTGPATRPGRPSLDSERCRRQFVVNAHARVGCRLQACEDGVAVGQCVLRSDEPHDRF